jgi:hypothetical protein
MSTKQIEMVREQVESIVVEELKESLEMTIDSSDPDRELIKALKTVIMYYMPQSEYEPYLRSVVLTEMVRESERMGLYD